MVREVFLSDGFCWRPVTGAAARKPYRCPGCDHEIVVGTAHVLAWPDGAVDERRHWHSACWRHRSARPARWRQRPARS